MKFTYYGHSCFALEIKGKQVLFDPFITGNELAGSIRANEVPADYILVSHGHGDHMGDLISIANRTQALCISNFEIVTWAMQQGIKNVHPMNHGGKAVFDFGTVKYVNAVHSSLLPDGTNGGNPGGFVLKTSEGNVYFAGDTALHMDMQLIRKFCKIDLAVLPVGDNFTMGYEDALLAAEMVQCRNVVGVHFDTFGYIKINHSKAQKYFSDAGYKLTLPAVGDTFEVK